MRAFLSHSSKDKHFVHQVFKLLGTGQAEYDEATFSYAMNVTAIREALNRCEVFVLFLSRSSLTSDFVAEEERAALERRGKGFIKRIMIFTLDDASHRDLPPWLQELNIVQRLSSAKSCARRIQSVMWAEAVSQDASMDLYVGRDEEKTLIRRALSQPPSSTPVFLHIIGLYGVGRRTFLKKSLSEFLPRRVLAQVEVTAGAFGGPEELYRQLYDLHNVASLAQKIKDFDAFSAMTIETQCLLISNILVEMNSHGEFVILMDEGNGIFNDEGEYQPHFKRLMSTLSAEGDPMVGVVQSRMMPMIHRTNYPRAYHQSIKPLTDESTKDLLSLSLKAKDIDFSGHQLEKIVEFMDGHPFNVRFAVKFIEAYGIDSIIRDPSGLIDWKTKRAEDFLARIEFKPFESEILSLLNEYIYLSTDSIYGLLDFPQQNVAEGLRFLEDFCCIERREEYFHVSAPLRGAIRRDRRFDRSNEWYKKVASRLCESLIEYSDNDYVPVSIIESATIAAVRGADAPAFISRMILPSHLLRIAREHYGARKWSTCLKFCSDAIKMGGRLTEEGQVEAYRLTALSAIRITKDKEFNFAIERLHKLKHLRSASRCIHFLNGFRYRVRGRFDDAEAEFLKAWNLGRDNQSTNRELASLYCKQGRYSEAENFARAALKREPTNPYILDIMTETLLGRQAQGETVDASELALLIDDLKIHGDAPGISFYLVRQAQSLAKDNRGADALKVINKAVDKTSGLLAPYFIRATIHLQLNYLPGAEADVIKIESILEAAGGFSKEDEANLHELKAKIAVEKGQFVLAKEIVERSAFMPAKSRQRALTLIARAVQAVGDKVGKELKEWAERTLSAPPQNNGSGRLRRKGGTRRR